MSKTHHYFRGFKKTKKQLLIKLWAFCCKNPYRWDTFLTLSGDYRQHSVRSAVVSKEEQGSMEGGDVASLEDRGVLLKRDKAPLSPEEKQERPGKEIQVGKQREQGRQR